MAVPDAPAGVAGSFGGFGVAVPEGFGVTVPDEDAAAAGVEGARPGLVLNLYQNSSADLAPLFWLLNSAQSP